MVRCVRWNQIVRLETGRPDVVIGVVRKTVLATRKVSHLAPKLGARSAYFHRLEASKLKRLQNSSRIGAKMVERKLYGKHGDDIIL